MGVLVGSSTERVVDGASTSVSTLTLTNGELVTRRRQVLFLTISVSLMFIAIMAALGWEYIGLHDNSFAAPFENGWGVVLVTMGGLLRELTHRGL